MAELHDLQTLAASNTGRFPNGMQVEQVNDAARELEAMIARFVGGLHDGETLTVFGAPRYYHFPVPLVTGSVDDFLNLDYKAESHRSERYRRTAYDSETNTATYTYERTE
jgi:hypothetical protein